MFTPEEISLLLEALTAWEKEASQKAFSSALIAAIVMPKEEGKDKMDAEMAITKAEQSKRERRSIMLKAKLLQLEEEHMPDQLFSRVQVTES